MTPQQLQSLKARLAEIEREKADLKTHIKTLSALPEGVRVPQDPAGPRLRAPDVPDQWIEMHPHRVASLPGGSEALNRAGVQLTDETPPPGDSAEFAPPPDGVSIKNSVAPDHIQRSGFLRPGLPSAMPDPIPAPSHDRLRTYLGASAFNRPKPGDAHRKRLNPDPAAGSSRAKAIFLVGMVLLLGYLVYRAFT